MVASSIRDLRIAVCTVATIGPEATQQASSDSDGTEGSCTCSTSNVALLEPAADPVRRQRAERQPGHRPVVRDRHRLACRDHVGRQRAVLVGRGDHRDLVAELDQRLGQVPDVLLHAAGHVPRVRARDAYPHGRAPWSVMRRTRWPRATRWPCPRRSRCRGAVSVGGASAAAGQALRVEVADEDLLQHVPVLRVLKDRLLEDRARAWVIAAAFSLRLPSAGTGISS